VPDSFKIPHQAIIECRAWLRGTDGITGRFLGLAQQQKYRGS
jgi:hypothetical protein